MGNRTVTIKEIAKILGVSKSTVSRALRDSTEIGQETKKRVLDLARELNYSPNPLALGLLRNKSNTIGVIVPNIANPFFSSVIGGIEDIAYNRGYHVTIYQSHESYERELSATRHIAIRHVDGLIASVASGSANYNHFKDLVENNIPVVFFDRAVEDIQTHKILVDDYKGAFMATEHLIDEGFRRIAHIAGPQNLSISRNRLQGYQDALTKHGIELKEEWIVYSEFSESGGEALAHQLMASKERPDAIFAASDRIAIGVYAELRRLGYKIPDEIALIGFSGLTISALLDPPLSTMVQPTFEMGQQSAELLLKLIEAKKTPTQFETRILHSEIIVRKSSQRKSLQK